MKYFKLKFLLIFAALAMAIPPAWAKTAGFSLASTTTPPIAANTNPATGTITGTQGETWNVTIEGTFTSSTMQGSAGAKYWQMGKSNASIDMATFSTNGINGTITKIVVVCASITSAGGQVSVDVNNQTFSPTQSMPLWENNTGGELTFNGSASGPISIKMFPVLNKGCLIQSITVTYEDNSPDITITPPETLPFNDEGGVYIVNASNLPDNGLGVSVSDGFSRYLINGDNTDYYFSAPNNAVTNGQTRVNYTGRELSATGTITYASGSANQSADLSYRSDIYIYSDYRDNQGWRFADETPMTFANNNYTATVNIENEGSCILFGRKLGTSYGWNDDRLFFSAKKTGNWGYNYEIQDWIYGADECNELEFSTNSQYHCIKFNEKGKYTITINATAKTFSIVKAPEPTGPVTYEKVTSTEDVTDGNYLIVYESGNVAFDGTRTTLDGTSNTKSVTIDNEKITTSDPIYFTYNVNAKTLKSASGYYIGRTTTSNGLDQSQNIGNGYVNYITIDEDGNASIILPNQSNLILKYNKSTGQERFRYFTENNTQQAIQLYKEAGSNKVATPTFTPDGDTFIEAQNVEISCATEGATIHYTTNGDDPDEFSAVYNTPISVTETTTIKAIAMKDGWRSSDIAEAVYTIVDLSGKTKYTKVTNTADLTDGYYLIVYEDGKLAFDGSLETLDASGNTFDDLVISSDNIIYTDKEGYFTIDVTAGTIKSASGKYIGNASDTNGLTASDNVLTNTISIDDDGNAEIVSEGGAYLRYNATSGQDRFRYFKSSTYTAQKAIQLYKSEVVPVLELAVSLPEAPEEHYKVGQVAKVKATVENGSETTQLTYKVGEETLTVDNDGKVTLPNKKSGEVVLTVTATDGEKTATDTKTYVFDKADALTITLTPATGTYYVDDEQNVTVTVEDAIDANPTITYKFGEEGTVQNYNAETGILLPTSEAGTINLIVMVDDNGYEHAGETTATGSYTINYKALTVTLTPESGTYTVGQEAKVKVTVENAVGELVVEYKIGNKDYEPDAQGYITLPNEKAGEVTLTVTALDSRPDAQAVEKSGTYIFTAAPAITFTMNTTETNYTVGDEIKVKVAEVKNAIGDYAVTYKIGDTTLTPDEDGYVTIPSDEAGEVELTVTVEDLYDHAAEATQTITFNIAAAPAIGITLTATPEAETYTVGDKVNVKVTTTNTIGNDVEITYSTNFTREGEQTYNPEKGIDITSDKAGTVTLTVNVFDGYEHEGADESDITSKTATYTFNAAPAIEITLTPNGGTYDINDNVNVKVDVDKTIGNDYLVVYQINDGEEQNYTEAGITIPSDKAETVTLKVTVEDGYEHEGEAIVTAEYKFNPAVPIAAPTFSPAAGTYTEPKQVAIACATPGVTIEYSINGGAPQAYTKPFMVSESCTVTATASKGSKVVYNDSEASAQYTINPAAAAAIADDYYYMQNNELSSQYANVAGRRTLNFVADPDQKAGTVFRVETGNDGAVKTLRSQAVDLQGYANRAMAYVPKVIDLVLSTLNNAEGVDDATGAGNILGDNGVQLILKKFYENFDYNLYVEGTEGAYRIYGRTPSMQHVVDFYHENTAQVEAKLPDLEDYINQVLDKIRSKIGQAGMNEGAIPEFTLKAVRDRIAEKNGIALIDPDVDEMGFYRQVLNNKEYVWDFAYQTAMMYVDVIKQTQTYLDLDPEYKRFVDKMQNIRPETKYYMIQYGNEPDYVSENNVKIIGNDPSTFWTLTKRDKFTVNVPAANELNGSYYTTLYTDFGYELPDGVNAYAVTGIDDNNVAELTEITDAIPAQTPVLLKSNAAGDKVLTIKKETRGGAIEGNLLEGPDYLINKYQFEAPTVVSLFTMAAPFVPADMLAEYEYLKLRNSGTVNNKYFWNVNSDLSDIEGVNVLRGLSTNTGELAFSDDSMTEDNKAFMVSETKPVIYLSIDTVATPTLSLVPGSYTGEQTLDISCATNGAKIYYSTDGGNNWTEGTSVTLTEDCTVMVKAEKDGMIPSKVVTAEYIIDEATEQPDVPAMKGYYQIMNNENEMYANVAGRRTLNFKSESEAESNAGTIFYLETNDKGQVQSLRSQGVDLQGYANRAMRYVPDMVQLVVKTLQAEGSGEILGENGLDEIMAKFNECFDYHLYLEPVGESWRIYGKTPSMQHVVDFYRAHTAQVEAKLPMLEDFINDALTKLRNKIGGETVFTPFSLHQIWENMGGNLPEPVVGNDAAIMDFYRAVLNNKNYVWDFAYQTAQIYWNNVKRHPRYNELKAQLGEYADYIDEFVNQVRPDFKYYIIQRGNEPDYISEGNAEINDARSLWTLEPRETFKLSSAGELFGCPLATTGVGGYFTTNYTDFAYTLPDGVTAYKVTDVDADGEAVLEVLTGTIPAQTPVLLVAKEDGEYEVTLTTDAGTAVSGNLLQGPDYLITLYQFKTQMVVDLFSFAQGILGDDLYNTYVAPYEYLQLRYSGTVNNKYFWNVNSDIENITGTNVIRSLSTETGELAFSDNTKTEDNKAFMVSEDLDVIKLPGTLRGDVNHDGAVNIQDVTDLIDRLLENNFVACPYCSDVNEDTGINIQDVTDLIDILLSDDGSTTNP